MARRTFGGLFKTPGVFSRPVPPGDDKPQRIEVEGVGPCFNLAAFARLLHDIPKEEMGNEKLHPLCDLLRQRVADAMATARALGKEPDLQETINELVDLDAMRAEVDAACAGKPVDMAKSMFERLSAGVQ